MSMRSTDSRALMADRAESRLISSRGWLRGWELGSTFVRRCEEDLAKSEDDLTACLEELERWYLGGAAAVVVVLEVGVAGEAGRADFFVDELDEAGLSLAWSLEGRFPLVGEDDSA